tara:strand:+ start:567 stop:776 length:210 start_codon:yes stop_codon:yes gene_type:complete
MNCSDIHLTNNIISDCNAIDWNIYNYHIEFYKEHVSIETAKAEFISRQNPQNFINEVQELLEKDAFRIL